MAGSRCITGLLAGGALLLGAGSATAQPRILDPDTFSPYLDLRLSAADGLTSWLSGDTGKLLPGAGDHRLNASVAEAGLVWRPRFSWTLSGYAHLQYQDYQDAGLSLVEGFVRYRPVPTSPWRISGRAGVFYPPVSMEHVNEGWSPAATVSASAINSWIGEEVKGTGVEIRAQRNVAGQQIALTGGLFGYNDTTGVLISHRGWALHDIKTGQGGDYVLSAEPGRDRLARPFLEADDRPGYYARLDWSPAAGIDFNIIHWDNRADPLTRSGSSPAWLTKFVNVGAAWQINDHYQLIGQVMSGTTVVGSATVNKSANLDIGYRAAYALLVREAGPHIVGLRADWFEVEDRSPGTPHDFGETGWAATAAYRFRLSDHQLIAAELLHTDSDRPQRQVFGHASHAAETQFQLSWRLSR